MMPEHVLDVFGLLQDENNPCSTIVFENEQIEFDDVTNAAE